MDELTGRLKQLERKITGLLIVTVALAVTLLVISTRDNSVAKLIPGLAEGHRAMGMAYYLAARDYPVDCLEFKQADDDALNAHVWPAEIGLYDERAIKMALFRKAEQSFRRSIELEPTNPESHFNLAVTLYDMDYCHLNKEDSEAKSKPELERALFLSRAQPNDRIFRLSEKLLGPVSYW